MSSQHDSNTTPAHRAGGSKDAPKGVHRAATEPLVKPAPRRSLIVLVGLLALALGLPAAFAATGGLRQVLSSVPDNSTQKPRNVNLVVNGDFEKGTNGWRVNRPRRQSLGTASVAVQGRASAALSTTTNVYRSAREPIERAAVTGEARRRGKVTINDEVNTVRATSAGRKYVVSAYVRARGAAVPGRVRIREVAGNAQVGQASATFRATKARWTKVGLTYTARRTGSELDLNVVGRRLARGSDLLVDKVTMVAVGASAPAEPSPTSSPSASPSSSPSSTPSGSASPSPTPSSSPSTTPTKTPTPTPSASPTGTPTSTPTPTIPPSTGGCVSDPMGIPTAGAYLGAAVNGTSSLSTRESQLGQTLALRRTYYNSGQIDSAVRTAKSDLALGRLPWISFKAPYSWAQMAAGQGDAWTTQLADGLKTVPGPVWVAVHHEPEGDGDMADWTAMQARMAPIIHDRTNNVAWSIIYSGWNTFGNNTNTIATKWPGDANVDILAIDAYNDMGASRGGREGTKTLELETYYTKMSAWAKAHGTAWAIGETGQTRKASATDPTWLDRAYLDMVALGGAGLSYYDSSANSVSDWTLDDPIKFARFKSLMAQSERVC